MLTAVNPLTDILMPRILKVVYYCFLGFCPVFSAGHSVDRFSRPPRKWLLIVGAGYLHCVPRKCTSFYFSNNSQILTNFNDFWCVKS